MYFMKSAADLHVVAALVAGLAAVALGHARLVDLAFDDVAGVSPPVAAPGIGFLLDHQFAAVPARLGRRLAGGTIALHEAYLALALVIERIGRPEILFALCGRKPGTRTPVAAQEGEILFLLGLRRHHHRLGLVLLVGRCL